jgi:glycosyltransferase involved in cell wall biosynthesis
MSHSNLIAIWACALAKATKTKVVLSEHSNLSGSILYPENRRAKILPMLMKRFYRKAHAIVAVSNGVAADLSANLKIAPAKINTIYNPIIDEKLIEKSMEEVNHRWFASGQPPVVLSVGRLTEAKDYPVLLEAFAEVLKDCQVHLLILGEGEIRPELEKIVRSKGIEQYVEMPGYVENPYPFMRQAAVFVLSSKQEGCPNVLVEALACGAKVVATDCESGPGEILACGKYGKLVPVGNVNLLSRAITDSLKSADNDTIDNVSHLDQFTTEQVVKKYLDLMETL